MAKTRKVPETFFVISCLILFLLGCGDDKATSNKRETRTNTRLDLLQSFERTKSKIREIDKAQREKYQTLNQDIR